MKKKYRIGLTIVVILFLYITLTAILPYVEKSEISDSFQETWDVNSLYAQEISADRVALVEKPEDGLKTRIFLIRQATQTLDLSYYAIHSGESTNQIFSEVLAAANRGVKVRLLFDGMSGNMNADPLLRDTLASHENIEFKLYNEIALFKPWTWNGRLHDKYIIVDNKFLLLGGRNIGDKYFDPDSYTGDLSYDRDVLVYHTNYAKDDTQSVVLEVKEYMDSIFYGEHVKLVEAKKNQKIQKKLEELALLEQKGEFILDEEMFYEITMEANKVTFINNGTQISKKEPVVWYVMKAVIKSAKEEVILQSPYVIEDREMLEIFQEVAQENAEIQLLTNSIYSSPNLPAFSLYQWDKGDLLETGVSIYEYQEKAALHGKSYLVDERLSMVGSCNLDPRSFYINTELMLVIDSEDFYEELRNEIDGYREDSALVDDQKQEVQMPVKSLILKGLGFLLSPFKFLV